MQVCACTYAQIFSMFMRPCIHMYASVYMCVHMHVQIHTYMHQKIRLYHSILFNYSIL